MTTADYVTWALVGLAGVVNVATVLLIAYSWGWQRGFWTCSKIHEDARRNRS